MASAGRELSYQLYHHVFHLEKLASHDTASDEVVQVAGVPDEDLFKNFDGYTGQERLQE